MDAHARAAKGMSFTAAALGVILLVATVTQLPAGLVGEKLNAQRETFRLFWPQGMLLFTHAARREFTVAYHHDEAAGTFVPITRTAGDPAYLRGLDRRAYADIVRLLATADELPDEHWQDCSAATVTDCAAVISKANRLAVTSRFSADVPCGRTVFTIERPDPGPAPVRRVLRVAVADLQCAPR